jgi:hypothetical protein
LQFSPLPALVNLSGFAAVIAAVGLTYALCCPGSGDGLTCAARVPVDWFHPLPFAAHLPLMALALALALALIFVFSS